MNQTGVLKAKYICVDDSNWLEKTDNVLNYALDCIYSQVSSINLIESNLHYAYKVDANNWIGTTFSRYACGEEILKWSAYALNLTFTTQAECNRNTEPEPGYRQGLKCVISKEFLRLNMFKLNRVLLNTRADLYPIPYGLYIKYTCN
ncbi:hypothetical protein BpHYR1_032022 [Brachionus plicatilis]|uniref:Uncharacterized protein n=1 Tax=Brachionus plicatilis TaxID=10195 RepID=A0A3M7T1I3_BRAPC|nr:hypothetical protein BpHYR1_032022 [Brachionus plicatilis]